MLFVTFGIVPSDDVVVLYAEQCLSNLAASCCDTGESGSEITTATSALSFCDMVRKCRSRKYWEARGSHCVGI